jgi:hypothetical protein
MPYPELQQGHLRYPATATKNFNQSYYENEKNKALSMKGILVDDNGELIVNNGSMTIDDVVFQSSALLIAAFTGEMKTRSSFGR